MRNKGQHRRRTLISVLAMGVALGYLTPASSFADPVTTPGTYVAGGTAVVKDQGKAPTADEGTVVCSLDNGSGTGGACVPFGVDPLTGLPGDSVLVQDAAAGQSVAFQVCLDNNGDSVCTFPDRDSTGAGCSDQVFFSHDDAGNFFNPIGPLPAGFAPGCPGGPYPGYVVFLCEGAHTGAAAPHSHAATTGRANLVHGGTGFGDFCGGVVENPTRKQYFVTGGAGTGNYVSGGTAVAKQNGQAPAADSGALACNSVDGSGVGGACVQFGPGDSVLVNDAANGTSLAFQVCLDNNGDGICTSPDVAPCPDQIFFSHDDAGNFFNALGPLPTSFLPGCPGGAWQGYVVFLCQGAHVGGGGSPITTIAPAGGHVHAATKGTASLTIGGTGFGTFCGGARTAPSRKAYIVV